MCLYLSDLSMDNGISIRFKVIPNNSFEIQCLHYIIANLKLIKRRLGLINTYVFCLINGCTYLKSQIVGKG